MTEHATGRITTTAKVPVGTSLAQDHASGSTTLVVVDPFPFDEDGGTLDVNGVTYTFTGWDDDTDTITLASGLTGAAEAGDRVLVLPAETEMVAVVTEDESGEQIEADVRHSDASTLPEGTVEPPVSVSLVHDGDRWLVDDIVGRTPTPDAGLLVGTVPDFVLDDTDFKADLDQALADLANFQVDLTEAIAAAAAAQSSADGKSTTWHNVTPDAGPHRVGDTWFDNGAIKRWTGSAWSTTTLDGSLALADLSVGNAKIAALDAAKITTGFLAAARIAAGSIVTEKLDAGAVTAIKIATGALTAKIVSGDVIATAMSGQRVQVSTSGIATYNTSDDVTALLSAASGGLDLSGNLLVTGTGRIVAGNTTARAVLSTANPDGTGTRGYVSFEGNGIGTPGTITGYAQGTGLDEGTLILRAPLGLGEDGLTRTYAALSNDGARRFTTNAGQWEGLALGGTTIATAGDLALEPSGYVTSVQINTFTASGGAGLAMNGTTARIHKISSSLRYKADPQPMNLPPDAIEGLVAYTWLDKGELERYAADPENEPVPQRYPGFIAENLDAAEHLEPFVIYDDEDRPEGIYYDRLPAVLVASILDLRERVAILEGAPA